MGLLDGLLGGDRRGGGSSPITMALLGLLAYQAMKGKNLSDMFGGGARSAEEQSSGGQPQTSGGLGDLLSGGLGGLLGGLGGAGAGGILSGGLGDLLEQFNQHGQGDKAASWVGGGSNKQMNRARASPPPRAFPESGSRPPFGGPARSPSRREALLKSLIKSI